MKNEVSACLINQTVCGRVAGNPVCPKCGMDERVVYPGQADREAAQAAALVRYGASQVAVKPPPPPEPPKASTSPETPAQPPKQSELESPVTPGPERKGINRLGVGVLVLALMGGGWWWKDQQDQRVQQAQEQAAQQALAAEASRREREAEKKRADDAEAQRVAAEKASAQIAEQARREREAEKKRAEEGQAQRVTRERQVAVASQAPPPTLTEQGSAFLHGRYQILANGSEVKDIQTGLTWARCSVGRRWDGNNCAGQASLFNFTESLKLAGNGWRVPTARELASLVYCSSGRPTLKSDPEDGHGPIAHHCDGEFSRPTIRQDVFPSTKAGWYWSTTLSKGYANGWSVGFDYGDVGPYNAYFGEVRLVRTSQ